MREYVKPKILVEKFEISQQIAVCDYDSNNTSADENCQFEGFNKDFEETMIIFQSGCGVGTGATQVENYCYHNSVSSEYGIFNS